MAQLIPKVLHRVWVGPNPLPETARGWADSWRKHHPGWEMELWTDENLPGQLNHDVYERTAKFCQRADILKHEVLCQFGGVYVDIDFECLKNIEPLLEGVTYFYGEELPGRPALGILGCVAGHPFTRWCQLRLRERWPWKPGGILQETGPDFYGRAIRTYLGKHSRAPLADPALAKDAAAVLVPAHGLPLHAFRPWVFYPYYLGESWVPEDHPESYAVHHWQKNWEF